MQQEAKVVTFPSQFLLVRMQTVQSSWHALESTHCPRPVPLIWAPSGASSVALQIPMHRAVHCPRGTSPSPPIPVTLSAPPKKALHLLVGGKRMHLSHSITFATCPSKRSPLQHPSCHTHNSPTHLITSTTYSLSGVDCQVDFY